MASTRNPTDPLAGYKNLAGPAGPSTPGAALAATPGMQTPATGGGTGGPAGLQPQQIGSGDSLTAFFRSLTNLTGGLGANQFAQGGQTVNAGLGTVGSGLGTLDTALGTLQAPEDFYKKLLSGDPAAMTAALAPTASLIGGQYANLTNQTSQNTAQGGFRSTALAGLPFAQTAQVGNAALGLQPAAAQGLQAISGAQAGIGGKQSDIGLGVGQLGAEQQKQGLEALFKDIDALLGKMGVNQQGSFANQFDKIASGISSLGTLIV